MGFVRLHYKVLLRSDSGMIFIPASQSVVYRTGAALWIGLVRRSKHNWGLKVERLYQTKISDLSHPLTYKLTY